MTTVLINNILNNILNNIMINTSGPITVRYKKIWNRIEIYKLYITTLAMTIDYNLWKGEEVPGAY